MWLIYPSIACLCFADKRFHLSTIAWICPFVLSLLPFSCLWRKATAWNLHKQQLYTSTVQRWCFIDDGRFFVFRFAHFNYLIAVCATLRTEFGPANILCFLYLHTVTHIVTLLPQVHHKSLSLGEVLDGDRMAESLYHIRFRENLEKRTLCQLTLSEKQVCIYTCQAGLILILCILPASCVKFQNSGLRGD